MKTIAFDMDGTIADLYGQKGWLSALENEDASIFASCEPLVDIEDFKRVCHKLQNKGWTIGVITWLPKFASEVFERECEETKKYWLKKHGLDFFQFVSCQKYGTDKKQGLPFRGEYNILIDDNSEVRAEWNINDNYIAVDEKCIIEKLQDLL